jgi:hypothetical protein
LARFVWNGIAPERLLGLNPMLRFGGEGTMIGNSGAWVATTTWGGAAVCVLALAGWHYARMSRSGAPDIPPPAAAVATADASSQQAASPAPNPAPPAQASGASAPASESSAPRADIVRVLPTGDVVVAGRAEPGARVALFDHGEPLMEMQADAATGEFVFLPPRLAAGAHRLTLRNVTKSEAGQANESAVMDFSVAPDGKVAAAPKPAPSRPIVGAPAAAAAPEAAAKSNMATVARGDTLWRLSREKFGRGALYPTIIQANPAKIRDPNLIYPGQSLAIP